MNNDIEYDELMYQKLHNSDTYRNTFKSLTKEEKDIYFIYLPSYIDVYSYLKDKDDEFIFNYIKNHQKQIQRSLLSSSSAYELLYAIKDKKGLLDVFEYLPINMINSHNFKKIYLEKLENDEERMKFINKIIDNKIEIYFPTIINTLEDKNKVKYFNQLTVYSQVTIIKEMTDLELKKEYSLKPEYSNFRSELVSSVEDENFIIEMFDKINSKKFRANLICKIKDENLKDKLLKRLGYKTLNKFLDSFEGEMEIIQLDDDVDPKITIGVELETCHKDIEVLKILKDIPNGFQIHKDASVVSGFEVVSPILHYTSEDMSKLKYICNILKQNNFYTNKTCGGHIHIGADYLETIDEYKMLLHLYCNFEDIIYLICNKANTKGRPSINSYAAKTKKQYSKAQKEGVFEEEYSSLSDFQQKLVSLNDSRYKGLNVYNLKKYGKNTIEFRMANGEIEFEELRYNIKLYARLVQVAKELANNENNIKMQYLKSLNKPLKDIDRLNILLSLLFTNEEDRKFYKNRYKKNLKSIRNLLSCAIPTVEYTQIINPFELTLKYNGI